MSHYVSLKITDCTPEKREGKDGFRVTYEDGYVSWCPVDTHNRDYLPIGWMHHCDREQRRAMAYSVVYEERLAELETMLANEDTMALKHHTDRYWMETERDMLKAHIPVLKAAVGGMLIHMAKNNPPI